MDNLLDDELEVLSGNHRVKSAIKASLATILVIVIPLQTGDAKVAKQLSHNAIAGQDDKQILADLWKEVQSIEGKLYSGLDSALVAELEKIKFAGFNAQQLRTESIALWFLPEEVEALNDLLNEAVKAASADTVYLVPLAKYGALFDALVKTKTLKNIKNTAVAFMWLIDRLADVLETERAGSVDSDAPAHQVGEGGAIPAPALSTVQ